MIFVSLLFSDFETGIPRAHPPLGKKWMVTSSLQAENWASWSSLHRVMQKVACSQPTTLRTLVLFYPFSRSPHTNFSTCARPVSSLESQFNPRKHKSKPQYDTTSHSLRCDVFPFPFFFLKKKTENKCWCAEICDLVHCYHGNTMIHDGSLMLLQVNNEITMCSSNPTSGYILRRTESRMSEVCSPVCTTLFTIAKR